MIGWRDSENTELPRLTSSLTASSSGLYYNDAHPLVTIENIYATGPNYDGVANTTWSNSTTYAKDAVVRYNGVTYISLQAANLNKTPSTQTAWWKGQLNNHIERLTNTAIVNMAQRVINDKQNAGASKALMDDVRVFDGDGRQTSTIVGQSRFVGFEIIPKAFGGLQVAIQRIGAQFTELQSGLNIYLYHSSQKSAVATYSMTTTKAYSMEWVTPTGFTMNFSKYTLNDAGGLWYMGYFEDDITGQAINRDLDIVSEPCGTCLKDAYNRYAWELRNRYFELTPCVFEAAALDGTNIPDIEKVSYIYDKNFGMNLAMSVQCDLTDFFISNKNIFVRALWMQLAHDALSQMAFSTRIDGLKQTLRNDAYAELKGDPNRPYRTGIEYELSKEYEALCVAVGDMNSPCLSKKNKGIKVGGI